MYGSDIIICANILNDLAKMIPSTLLTNKYHCLDISSLASSIIVTFEEIGMMTVGR